jgi:hypothetical protein
MASDAGDLVADFAEGARRHWKEFVVVAAVGLVFLCMNFPKLLGKLLYRFVPQGNLQRILAAPIQATQASLGNLRRPSPEVMLTRLMSWNFLLLLLFLALVALLALRHKDFQLPAFCLSGLALGYFGGELVAWIVVIVIKLFSWAAVLVHWIGSVLGWLFEIALHWWGILAPLVVIVLVIANRDALRAMVARWRGRSVDWPRVARWTLGVLAGLGAIWLVVGVVGPWIWSFIGPIVAFLGHLLGIVFHFVGKVIAWLVTALLVALAVGLVLNLAGRLLVDQVRSAWCAGKGRKEMALAGFALGSALALIVLMSAGTSSGAHGVDQGWQASLSALDHAVGGSVFSSSLGSVAPAGSFWAVMPRAVRDFAVSYFDNANPPLVDSLILLVILGVASASALRGLFSSVASRVPHRVGGYFLPSEYLAVFGGLVVALIFVVAQGATESTDS